jgi:hypothetical protein
LKTAAGSLRSILKKFKLSITVNSRRVMKVLNFKRVVVLIITVFLSAYLSGSIKIIPLPEVNRPFFTRVAGDKIYITKTSRIKVFSIKTGKMLLTSIVWDIETAG